MSTGSSRQRAEAALGHLQIAAGEVIAAAREALDLLEGVVSEAEFDDLCDRAGHVGRALLHRWLPVPDPPAAPEPREPSEPAHAAGARPRPARASGRAGGTVQHIAVR